MLRIRLQDLEFPEGWRDRAERALSQLENARTAKQRAAVIRRHSDLWRELKPKMADLSNKKCWYCESSQARSDMRVDHYRPKGRVDGVPKHKGYWWLAFEPSNLRYTCTFCNEPRTDDNGNVGGKWDCFPLVDEDRRAYCAENVDQETPVLLDPAVLADTMLLYFREDGIAEPRDQHRELHRRRAQESINLYHLNHSRLLRKRSELFEEIREAAKEARIHYNNWKAGNDTNSAKIAFDSAVNRLERFIDKDSEYSAAARDFLKGLRDNDHRPWIDSLV